MSVEKDLWFEALEDFEWWWTVVCEYANCDGDSQLPRDFYQLNDRVSKFVRTQAGLDRTPFFEIGGLVKRHAGIISSSPACARQPDPYATIGDIHNAIYRALPAKCIYHDMLADAVNGTPPKVNGELSRIVTKAEGANIINNGPHSNPTEFIKGLIDKGTIRPPIGSGRKWQFYLSDFSPSVQEKLR